MKNKNISYLIVTFILLLVSCNNDEFFELERPPQAPWSTVAELERAPLGVYASLFSGDQWEMPWVDLTVVKVSEADDVDWVNAAEWGYWRESKEFNRYTDRAFQLVYRAIAGVNNALAFYEENDGNPFPNADEDDMVNIRRIEGELYFIRAFAYFYLQNIYGHAYVPGGDNSTPDIPLITKFASSETEAKTPKTGTTAEIFNQIKTDFEKAKELLPTHYDPAIMPETYAVRANKFAAAAMLAKTLFMMGEYDDALAEYNFVIEQNGGQYDLSEDPIEAWNKSSIERGKEVIFYLPYFATDSPDPKHLTVLNNNAGAWGKCGWCETRMGASTIKRLGWMNAPENDTTLNINAKADKRFQQLFAVRYPASLAKPGQLTDARAAISGITTIWSNKYYRGPGNFKTNVPLIRMAELYLSRAILRFRAGDKDGAAADLNKVRERAWDVSIGGTYTPVTSATITEQMINDERIIEMFGENDRIDYLRSLKIDIPNGERGSGSVPYTSEDFVWKLPDNELIYNESM